MDEKTSPAGLADFLRSFANDQFPDDGRLMCAAADVIDDARAMLELLRQWVTGSATWQDLADARALVLRHAPETKLDAISIPPPHPAVALLSEALYWLEDPSAYAQDRARDFDTRARALLDEHGRKP